MLAMGDEVRRSQQGNNNAYCQDSAISWFDWDDVPRHAGIRRFARGLIHFHQESAIFRDSTFWGQPGATKITWHGVRLGAPEWGDDSHALAYELLHVNHENHENDDKSVEHVHVMLNAYWEPLEFELPATGAGRVWQRMVDTGLESPLDFCDPPVPLAAGGAKYTCQSRSTVVLVSVKA
jgi:glycogen operon protein